MHGNCLRCSPPRKGSVSSDGITSGYGLDDDGSQARSHDLWPESIVAVGALRRGWGIRLCERIEAWAYRKADRIVRSGHGLVPAPHRRARSGSGRDHCGEERRRSRAVLSPTEGPGPGAGARLGRQIHRRLFRHPSHGARARLGPQGGRAAARRPRIVFLLVGDGAERRRLQAMKERLGLPNVVMFEQ
jgi:colanic acid biosynthesis glycosyl transferase WcaI